MLSRLTVASPPVGVGGEGRSEGASVEVVEDPRTGTGRTLVERGAVGVVRRRDQRLRVVDRDQRREVAVRSVERDDHGEVAVGHCAAFAEHAADAGRFDGHAIEGGNDISRSERRVVLPHDAFAEGECPHAAVVIRAPVRRERRRPDAAAAIFGETHEIFEALRQNGIRAEVEHVQRVESGVRIAGLDAGEDRSALASAAATRGALGGRCCVVSAARVGYVPVACVVTAATCGDDSAHERHRETDDRAALHEIAAVDLSLCVGLDEVHFDCTSVTTCAVQMLPIHIRSPLGV